MPQEPVPADPGWDDDPAWSRPDPVPAEDEPFDPEEWLDPEGPPLGEDELTPEELAGIQNPAFGPGTALDVMPGCPELALFADAAAGADDSFNGVSADELVGVLGAWDRLEAHVAARKLAMVAELIRRRPGPGCPPEGPARMPAAWDEFTANELAQALAESRVRAEGMLSLALALEARLPGTKAALRDGTLTRYKAETIAWATALLDPAEARAAAARDARVQRWAEDSGNAALMGRELPPTEVLAADQRITAWARQLRAAGLDGDIDELRARAYLDLLLGKDSRPSRNAAGGGPGQAGPDQPAGPPAAGPAAGAGPGGFAGRVTVIVPLTTLLDLAERPGEIPGIGPVDPALAHDLARAAAQNPATTWCVTVTDEDGHAIGHGCARPEPKNHRKRGAKRGRPGPPDGRDPPRGTSGTPGPGFSFTASSQHGPPGGYSTWRLRTGGSGHPDLIVTLDPIPAGDCDHRFEAKGHDPGCKLRHLSQVRHATCTGPVCRRPSTQSDFEHNIP